MTVFILAVPHYPHGTIYLFACREIRGLLGDDIAAVSALRCLRTYLERLGLGSLSDGDGGGGGGGGAGGGEEGGEIRVDAGPVTGCTADSAGVRAAGAAYGMAGLGVMMAVEVRLHKGLLRCFL